MIDKNIQTFMVKGLFENLNYFRNVLNNLDPIFFDIEKAPVIKFFKNYYSKYEKVPDYSIIVNVISSNNTLDDDMKKDIEGFLDDVKKLDFDSNKDGEWLFDETKKYINNQAMFHVLKEGAIEINKEDGDPDYGRIEKKMREALSLDWNEDVGIDFFDEDGLDAIYDILLDNSIRIPTGVEVIDSAINGGIPGQTKFLAVYVGSSGLGKTLIMGNTAINAVKSGKNVLYISFEIDEKELKKRLDASYFESSIRNVKHLRHVVKNKIKDEKNKGTNGRFILKEFPTGSVTALDVESYLHTLQLKKDFKPDFIVLDYLGIMRPISKNASNSYERGKDVCEEIRALSDRIQCPIITASQTNRDGYGSSSIDMDNIADSMGIAHTADLIIGLTQTDELKDNNQIKFQVIKSRVSQTGAYGLVNVDYDKLQIINENKDYNNDITSSLQEGISAVNKKVKKDSDAIGSIT